MNRLPALDAAVDVWSESGVYAVVDLGLVGADAFGGDARQVPEGLLEVLPPVVGWVESGRGRYRWTSSGHPA